MKQSVSVKPEEAVKQALQYAFQAVVPFIVLSDGKVWSFYLPAVQGSYEDRRVYTLDLFERSPKEAAETLKRHLACARVISGSALETANEEYKNRFRRTQARDAIPQAWHELVEKGNEELVQLLTEAAESIAGVSPDDDDVEKFLAALNESTRAPARLAGASHITTFEQAGLAEQNARSEKELVKHHASGTLVVLGKKCPYMNAKDAMVIVLSELAKRDPSFLERCYQHPDARGAKRR